MNFSKNSVRTVRNGVETVSIVKAKKKYQRSDNTMEFENWLMIDSDFYKLHMYFSRIGGL